MTRMIGWNEERPGDNGRPCGIHPLASIGGPPEHREWKVGDNYFAPDIDPTALINAFCTVDGGMTYRQTTTIGARTFLQARVHLGHNVVVGDDCEICVGAVICGEVTIGNGVRVSGNTWVKPLLTIGDGAIIGGGSVVTKDIPPHEVWCGNPARFLKLADTHMAIRGFEARKKHGWQYAMTEDEWAAAERRVKFPSHAETMEHLYGKGGAAIIEPLGLSRTVTQSGAVYEAAA